jgi:hypothetical protein
MKISCPDEETLVDYLEHRLSDEDRSRVEEHLADCQLCLDSVIVIKNMVEKADCFELEEVPKRVTDTAVDLVVQRSPESPGLFEKIESSIKRAASRVTDSIMGPWGTLQPAMVRGTKTVVSEDLVRVAVSFEEINTEIEIEKTSTDTATIRVLFPEALETEEVLRVTLKKGEREIASYPFESTPVVFEDISLGHYSISLRRGGVELGVFLFEIKDSHSGS